MNIILGRTIGFCSGVKRAIRKVTDILDGTRKAYCLGQIIHNPEVVQKLTELGLVVVQDISRIPRGSHFIIRTHGLPEEAVSEARARELIIHDFTCPKVKNTHTLVRTLSKEGRRIFIIGDPEHPEVRAVSSIAPEGMIIAKPDDVPVDKIRHPGGVVVQTTFNPELFGRIVERIALRSKETLIYNTLCEETIRRQEEARKLAEEVDLMVVVGGRNSSNTKTLYHIAGNIVNAVHIESEKEINPGWSGERIGIISGASTPENKVRKVSDALKNRRG